MSQDYRDRAPKKILHSKSRKRKRWWNDVSDRPQPAKGFKSSTPSGYVQFVNKHQRTKLSKTCTYILRHQAQKLKLRMREDGYVKLRELLDLQQVRKLLMQYMITTYEEAFPIIQRVVRECQKQRFSLTEEEGAWYIRANQGHTILGIKEEKLLRKVSNANQLNVVVHGTYRRNLQSILKKGLSKMKRNHIHFATCDRFEGNMSGFRSSCEVLIYIDHRLAISDGIKFFVSSNGVVLTAGIHGILSPKYFGKVCELQWKGKKRVPGCVIWSRSVRKRVLPLQQDEEKLVSNININKPAEKNTLANIEEQSVDSNREVKKKTKSSNLPTLHQSKVVENPKKPGHQLTDQPKEVLSSYM